MPTAAVRPPSAPIASASPKTSNTQISAQRSGRSSKPTIHHAAMDRGDRVIRVRIDPSP